MTLATLWRTFLGWWLPLIIGIVTAVIIAVIGLKTQWASNLTFGSGGGIDYIALFLWAGRSIRDRKDPIGLPQLGGLEVNAPCPITTRRFGCPIFFRHLSLLQTFV
jgi:hypothetical protein